MFGNQTPLFIPDQTSEEVLRAEEERGLTARPSLSASLCWGLWKPPAVGPQSCCLPGRELRRRKGGILLLKNWTKRMSTRREVSESWVFFHGSRVRELYSQGGVWTDCLGNGCPLWWHLGCPPCRNHEPPSCPSATPGGGRAAATVATGQSLTYKELPVNISSTTVMWRFLKLLQLLTLRHLMGI